LRIGWSADGEHGYHGYAWRRTFTSVGLDIWGSSPESDQSLRLV
jgi:hypothetical protein